MKYIYTLLIFCSLLIFNQQSFAQLASAPARGSITGKIRTNDGKAAAYVSVQIVENNRKTSSDENGNFTFSSVKPGDYTLRTSHVGLQVQTQKISVHDNQASSVDFTLSESADQLDEVSIKIYKSQNLKPANLGKSGIAPRDLPQAVQIIDRQIIEDQQVNRLSDVLKNVNGVAYGESRGSVNETFFARGYSLGANNLMKNGARTTGGGLPEVSTLESVEVLKGSAALLYGGVSGGAVVNMVTKKPKFENYGGEVSMRLGSYDLYKPTADIYGPISKKLAFRLIGTFEDAGSYRDNVTAKRAYINPSLLYKFSEKTELLVQGDHLSSIYTPDFGIGSLANKIVDIGRGTFLNTKWAYNKTLTTTGQANLTHKFDDSWKINVLAAVQTFNREYFGSERPAADVNGVWNRALTRSRTEELTYNQQINLTGSFNTGFLRHTLLVGGDADQSNSTSFAFNNPNTLGGTTKYYDTVNITDPSSFNIASNVNMPVTTLVSNTFTPIYRMGAFVQDLMEVTDKFKVLAGIRYTFQKTPRTKTTTYATGATVVNSNVINKSKIEKAWSPKFGLIYQPFKTTSVYVSYANNLISNTGMDVSGAPLDPSIVDQYEAGIKNDFLNGRLSANITAYSIKNSNFAQQALFLANGTPNGDTNIKELNGKTASDGVEIDLSGAILPGLNFIAGYSYNFIRYTETRDKQTYDVAVTPSNPTGKVTVGGTVEGQRLVGSTKNTANGSLFYTIQNGGLKGLKLGASAFYTGKRNGGYNDTKVQTASRLIPLGDFTTFDFSAGYSWQKLSLLGKISNITDELNYFVHENYSVNPISPRQFVTTLTYKF